MHARAPSERLRIAFFGLPLAAWLLHRDGHVVVSAAVCRRGAPGARRLSARRVAARVDVTPDASDPAYVAALRALEPDLVVSWFWTKRLPPAVLALAPAVGVHPSLLPRWRGPDPYFWAIAAGDEETGVTAHLLDDGYDTGAVLGRRRLRIDPAWNAWQLARRLDRPSLALLREVVGAYARARPPAASPQDEAGATWAPEPDEETLAIRWREPASRIARLVRAAAPWPGAVTALGGEPVVLTRVAPAADAPRALAPGEAWVRPDGTAVVRAGEGALELVEGRVVRENGERTLDRRALGERLGGPRRLA